MMRKLVLGDNVELSGGDLLKAFDARELRVLHRLVEGALNKNIAREMRVSVRTVENYRKSIMDKTGAKSPCQLGYLYAQSELMSRAPETLVAGPAGGSLATTSPAAPLSPVVGHVPSSGSEPVLPSS